MTSTFIAASLLSEPSLISAGQQFRAAELRSMALDGLLTHVCGDAYVRRGTEVTIDLRIQAISLLIPPNHIGKTILGRRTAAWIYGCAELPERVALLVDPAHRVTALRLWSGCLIHEVALGSYDVATIAGIRLSTPLRTAVDLALFENHPAGMDALTRLSRAESLKCPPATITAALKAQGRMPHKLEAIKRVDSLSSRPEPRPC